MKHLDLYGTYKYRNTKYKYKYTNFGSIKSTGSPTIQNFCVCEFENRIIMTDHLYNRV